MKEAPCEKYIFYQRLVEQASLKTIASFKIIFLAKCNYFSSLQQQLLAKEAKVKRLFGSSDFEAN